MEFISYFYEIRFILNNLELLTLLVLVAESYLFKFGQFLNSIFTFIFGIN